eukprot:TRINITY_DN59_c0_g1_i24.p1 TRINITY_DN59_c0_g1~~TRINITY_DN59_c0_g1_i24.p1  ORF type:complete len:890 (+),score=266.95 TRINITY_DN59_c0_g1_i24:247-2916(+)
MPLCFGKKKQAPETPKKETKETTKPKEEKTKEGTGDTGEKGAPDKGNPKGSADSGQTPAKGKETTPPADTTPVEDKEVEKKNKMPAKDEKPESIPPLMADGSKKAKNSELLEDQEDGSYLTYIDEEGNEYTLSTYLLDGERFYADEEKEDWVVFPQSWYSKGEWKGEEEPLFEMFIMESGEEYVTNTNEDGERFYCDFQTNEWRPFPEEWLPKGEFKPMEDEEEDAEPEYGTYTDDSGKVYTTVVAEESVKVKYYLDEEEQEWVKFPKEWMSRPTSSLSRNASRASLLSSRPTTRIGDFEVASDEKQVKATLQRQESSVVQSKDMEIATLKQQISDLEEEVFQLKSASAMAAKSGTSNAEMEKTLKELATVKKEKADIEKELASVKAAADQAEKSNKQRIEKLEAEIKSLNQKSAGDASLKQSLAEKTDALSRLETEHAEVVAKLTKLNAERSSSNKQIVEQVKKLNTEIMAMRPAVAQLQKDTVESRSEIMPKFVEINKVFSGFAKSINKELADARAQYRTEQLKRKKLFNQLQELKGNIRVYCRVRPLSKKEIDEGHEPSLTTFDKEGEVKLLVGGKKQTFEFERVYGKTTTQELIFEDTQPLITSVLDGYNVCIFAYGQTGAGKTYTMMGPPDNRGVNFRALNELYKVIAERKEWDYTISVSFIEIYNETIRDLLAEDGGGDTKYEVRQGPHGNYVDGLISEACKNQDEVVEVMARGEKNRTVGATAMNAESSRSHSLLIINVTGKNKISKKGSVHCSLTLVDLAGSERASRSEASGQRLVEAAAINKSLSALGNVISALQSGQSHIPYRNSKLTYILQDSLGGDSKTLMFLNCSPAMENSEETLCSLQFGQRVRNVTKGAASVQSEGGGKKKKGKKALPPPGKKK